MYMYGPCSSCSTCKLYIFYVNCNYSATVRWRHLWVRCLRSAAHAHGAAWQTGSHRPVSWAARHSPRWSVPAPCARNSNCSVSLTAPIPDWRRGGAGRTCHWSKPTVSLTTPLHTDTYRADAEKTVAKLAEMWSNRTVHQNISTSTVEWRNVAMRATCNYAYLYDTVGKMTVDFIQDCACGVGCSLVHLKANEQTINVMQFTVVTPWYMKWYDVAFTVNCK